MAAGQQKKRLNVANFTRFNSREQPLPKKKKIEPRRLSWNLRPHVSLKWDDNKRKAVARREQIGITWKDLSHFLTPPSSSTSKDGLADVFSIPEEIFQLDNLNEVLSYEVWEEYLSKSERDFLIQFLPNVKYADEVVQPLLTGENMHFGNPLDNWSACLFSGKLHPDAVIHHNRQLRSIKNDYYDQIKAYHDGMITCLLNWKERWESCKDPVKEIVERIWRKGVANHGTSPTTQKAVKTIMSKEQICDACKDPRKASKYMSYIKITRSQLQLVKNIKSGSDGIQSKLLSRVLGDVKGLQLQPYEAFEEEGSRRLHDHWLQLVREDLPLAFEELRKRRTSNDDSRMCIKREILEKLTTEMNEDEEGDNSQCSETSQAENTISNESHEFLTEDLVYGAENESLEGNDEEVSSTKEITNLELEENHERRLETDSEELEVSARQDMEVSSHQGMGVSAHQDIEVSAPQDMEISARQDMEVSAHQDMEVSAHQDMEVSAHQDMEVSAHESPDTSEDEISKGSLELSDLGKNNDDDALKQLGEDCSESSGNLGPEQADSSLPKQQLGDSIHHLGDVSSSSHLHEDHLRRIPSLNRHHNELDSEAFDYIVVGDNLTKSEDNSLVHNKSLEHFSPEDATGKSATSMDSRNLEKIPSLSRNADPDSASPYQETNGETLVTSGTVSALSPFPGNLETSTSNMAKPQDADFSAKDSWSEVGIQNSYPGSQGCNMYPFSDGLSLGGSNRVQRQPASVSLGGKMLIEETSGGANEATIFHSYANSNPYQNIQMPPFSKEQQLLSPYSIQQLNNGKRSNSPSFGQNHGLLHHSMYHSTSQEPKNTCQEQRDAFEQTQSQERELYIQKMANKGDFPNSRSITSDHNVAPESRDWLAFAAENGALPGHNPFSSELQPRNSWSTVEPPMSTGPRLHECRNADGSLYSILPEYSKTSQGLLGNIPNSDRLTYPGNFTSPGVGTFSNTYGFTHDQLSNPRSHDGSMVPPKVSAASWVDFPQQNSNLNGLLGKSNIRSWKQ